MQNPNNVTTSSTDKDTKQDARSSRMTLRKNNEEVLRKKLQLEAKSKCDVYFKDFAECAKQNSIMVVFRCREQNSASKFQYKYIHL